MLFSQFMLCQVSDVMAVEPDASFGYIIESGDQVDQSRLSASCASDDGCRLSRLCCKGNIFQYIFFCSRIPEGYMVEDYLPFAFFRKLLRLFRIIDQRMAFQYAVHTLCRYRSSWKHAGEHTDHQELHDNLHRALDKCPHITPLHVTLVYAVPYPPHHPS